MTPTVRVGATGFSLIAVCYGFARFAFGLFLPQIRGDLAFSATLAGVIAGGAFAAYCVAIIVAASVSERVGARAVAVAACVVAGVGMLGIALSPSAVWLFIFVVLAGMSSGLASPPMAGAVAGSVAPQRQDLTNTVINSGTSAGVALSGPIALAIGADWRLVFAIFAGIAFVLALVTFASLPAGTMRDERDHPGGLPPFHANLTRLIGASFLMGVSSTALWSFGGEITKARLDWPIADIASLWIAIGAAGIFGATAGWLTAHLGINTVHRLFLVALVAGVGMAGLRFTTPSLTLVGGALFGAAYVILTGVYLVWGTTTLPDRPATGLMVGFLTIALGQTAGAPLFGLLISHASLQTAILVFVCLGLTPGLFGFRAESQSKVPAMSA